MTPSQSATDIATMDGKAAALPNRSSSMVFSLGSSGVPVAPQPPSVIPQQPQQPRPIDPSAMTVAPLDGFEPRMFPGVVSRRRKSTATTQMGVSGQQVFTDGSDGGERAGIVELEPEEEGG
jgi:hypothetical protein